MRSLFTAGVLDAFMDHGWYFPAMAGISAGSLQGLTYVSHQRGRSGRVNTRFASDKRYMGMRHMIRGGSYFNFDFMFGELSHDIDPFDFHTFATAGETLYALMTDCETGECVYASSKSCGVDRFFTVCEGSCSIPLFSKPVKLGDHSYVDGGVGMPLSPLPSEFPVPIRKPVYILTRDVTYRKKPVPASMRALLTLAFGRKFPAVVDSMCSIPLRYNRKVDELIGLEKAGRVFIIRPDQPVTVTRVEKSKEKLTALYEEGLRIGNERFGAMMRWIHER